MMLKNRYYAFTRKDENQELLREVQELEQKYNCSIDNLNCDENGNISGPGEMTEQIRNEDASVSVSEVNDEEDNIQGDDFKDMAEEGNSENQQ